MIGDDIFVTEEMYVNKIGTLVTTIEILAKRIAAKDQRIRELEDQLMKEEPKYEITEA